MIRLLLSTLICLFFSLKVTSQSTYIPDDNFEQALIDLSLDDVLDDYVLNTNIENVFTLQLEDKDISDLTGIEGFTALESLDLSRNFLVTIDVSQNLNLDHLDCAQINTLEELNIKNGNNVGFLLAAQSCPNLTCVVVDDVNFVLNNINSSFFFTNSNNYQLTSNTCASLSITDNFILNLKVFPNPTTDYIYFNSDLKEQHFKIYNIQGKLVNEGYIDNKIDVSEIPDGLYVIKIYNTFIKFLKK